MPTTESTHDSPEDCANANTVYFDNTEIVDQGGKLAKLGECTECGRRFERVWLHSHDQCFDLEYEEVSISPRPH